MLPPGRRNLSGLKEELNVVIERTIPQTEEELKMIDVSAADNLVRRHEEKFGSPSSTLNSILAKIEDHCDQPEAAELLKEVRQHQANITKCVSSQDFEGAIRHRQLRDEAADKLFRFLRLHGYE